MNHKLSRQTADKIMAWAIDNKFRVHDGFLQRSETVYVHQLKNFLSSLVSKDEVDKCSICEGRKIMNQMYSMIDKIPLIGSSIFDNGIANIINELDDAKSIWCCMCLDRESEG